jgi:hypothetical protein
VFERLWFGTTAGCVYSNKVKIDNNKVCNTDEDGNLVGIPANATQTIKQHNFLGKKICGNVGGLSWLNLVRPSLEGACPDSYVACSPYTRANNTICVTNTNDCPILDIQFISTDQ